MCLPSPPTRQGREGLQPGLAACLAPRPSPCSPTCPVPAESSHAGGSGPQGGRIPRCPFPEDPRGNREALITPNSPFQHLYTHCQRAVFMNSPFLSSPLVCPTVGKNKWVQIFPGFLASLLSVLLACCVPISNLVRH